VLDLAKFFPKRSGRGQPLFMQLDNAEQPSRITGYWKTYFDQPTTQIQIHRIGYRETNKRNLSEPSDEIPWLKDRPSQLFGKCSSKKRFEWVGFYLDVAKEEIWSKCKILNIFIMKKD
jgi:hypothetical protein